MLTTEFSIPIYAEPAFADVVRGIFEIEGLLSYADEKLSIEIHRKEFFADRAKISTVELELDALREVTFKGRSLTLLPKRLSAFEDVPIAENARILLKAKRVHRKDLEALASHLQRILTYRTTPSNVGRIPFSAGRSGLREIRGELSLEGDEYFVLDVEDALAGRFDVTRQTIKVEPGALSALHLEPGRRLDRLYVRPKGRELLDAMPGSYRQELALTIRRKYRDQVDRLIYELERIGSRPAGPVNDLGDGTPV
jgi:hypothetical protein